MLYCHITEYELTDLFDEGFQFPAPVWENLLPIILWLCQFVVHPYTNVCLNTG